MIIVTRLNGKEFVVNAHMIETVESNPDSVITMYTERKFVVKESRDEIMRRIIEYNQQIFLNKLRIE